MPLKLASLPVKSQDRIRVEIVPLPEISVVLLAGISSRPVNDIKFGIIAPREPGRSASVGRLPALPGVMAGLSRPGYCMKPPDLFSSCLVEGRNHPVRPMLTASHACNNEVAGRERR